MGHSILIGLGVVAGFCIHGVADVWCEPVAATLEVPLEAAGKFGMTVVSRGDHIVIRSELSYDWQDAQEAISIVSGQSPAIDQVLLFDVEEDDAGFAPSMGQSVAMGDGWIVAAASFGNRVVTFDQSNGDWSEDVSLLRPAGAAVYTYFGYTVAGSGDQLAVGEIRQFDTMQGCRVLMYERQQDAWKVTQIIENADASQFGASIVMEDEWMCVAEPNASNVFGEEGTGEVSVYRHDGSTWNSMQILYPVHFDPTTDGGGFGGHMAISGDLLAVTARSVSSMNSGDAQVYVYRRNGMDWDLLGSIDSPSAGDASDFGVSVAIKGDLLAVGAWSSTGPHGFVHFYDVAGSGPPTLVETVTTVVDTEHIYAWSMAFSSESLIVGRPWAAGVYNGICDVMHLPDASVTEDCNKNGICDINDVLAGSSTDCDGDGILDECDPDSCNCPDPNDDGVVDTNDILLVISQWGDCPSGNCEADVDGDGIVDLNDLLRVINEWGPCS